MQKLKKQMHKNIKHKLCKHWMKSLRGPSTGSKNCSVDIVSSVYSLHTLDFIAQLAYK